jgi:uncharacterized protein YjiS (DUF1127 family)
MSTISNAPAAVQDTAGRLSGYSWASGPAAAPSRWWTAYIAWRIERTAINELQSMSELELKDIGLSRSEITGAVRYGAASRRPFGPYA